MSVIALLAFEQFVPRVRKAFAAGRIPPHCCDEEHFDGLIADARARPNSLERLRDEHMGYIDDILEALSGFRGPDAADADDDDFDGWDADTDLQSSGPAWNPLRDVGRNDPCPCGSGKKFKKCCGALQ